MSELRLPRLLSDGAVLQRRKSIHIWGWDEKGSKITVELCKEEDCSVVEGVCDEKGRFDVYLPARESGGPYTLTVSDNRGGSATVNDVMIGIVWFCSGQSNMELPITRVKDKYPEVVYGDSIVGKTTPITISTDSPVIERNDKIRTFKIIEETCFEGPYEELNTGSWVSVGPDTILNFSATGYFFAKHLQELTGQTVGFINASLGGSRISSWMSRQMLEGYDGLLAEADKYNDENFRQSVMKSNMENGNAWRGALYEADEGIKNHWEADEDPNTRNGGKGSDTFAGDNTETAGNEGVMDDTWKDFEIPGFFRGTELDGFIGSVWFRRKFDLPAELAGKKARLFLGTIVDNDIVFVNGQRVGDTPYQYPPRKYDIPEGLTREKDNTIAIRVCVETGAGRFTPGKDYVIFNEEFSAHLEGTWKYKIGAKCEQIPPTDFINWKSTGLYNAMTAPCHNFPVDGVAWYQGESNVEDEYDYNELTKRMVEGYRKAWGEENLPFIGVQLPNFIVDCPVEDDWGKFRLTQAKLLDIPSTGLVVTMGLGEDNDLHPVTKEPLGKRIALWAAHLKYCYNGEYTGPEVTSLKAVEDHNMEYVIEAQLSHAVNLQILDAGKGTEINDMFIVDESGAKHMARVEIDPEDEMLFIYPKEDVLATDKKVKFTEVMWCCDNIYHGGLLTNETLIPMGPFRKKVD